jgi:hypothetical protein
MNVAVCFDGYQSVPAGYVVTIKLTTDALNNPPQSLEVKIFQTDVDAVSATEPLETKIYSVAKSQVLAFCVELAKACDAIVKC